MTLPVYRILTSWPPLAAVVQQGGDFQVFPEMAPESAPFPFVIYSLSNKDPIAPLAGIPDMDYDQIMVDCWAKDRDGAVMLATLARDAFDHGRDGKAPWGYMTSGFSEAFDASARAWSVSFVWGLWTARDMPPPQRKRAIT